MMTHEELERSKAKRRNREETGILSGTALLTNFHVRADANGYRLPTAAEMIHAAFAGTKGAYPWGNDPAGYSDYAWTADNSGFHTHPVGRKKPNVFGLYDTFGNVSEMPQNTHRSYCFHLAMSFLDVVDRYRDVLRKVHQLSDKSGPAHSRGLMYSDVGFRVLLQAGRPVERRRAGRDDTAVGTLLFLDAGAEADASGEFDPLQGEVHRGNLGRTGEHQTTGLAECKGVKWTFQTGGAVRSSPVVVDGVVYVGSCDGHVYAIDAKSGKEKWKYDTGGRVSGSAAVVEGVVSWRAR